MEAGAVQVTSAEENEVAGQVAVAVKSETVRLTEARLSLTRPLDEAKVAIMDTFRMLAIHSRVVDSKSAIISGDT